MKDSSQYRYCFLCELDVELLNYFQVNKHSQYHNAFGNGSKS